VISSTVIRAGPHGSHLVHYDDVDDRYVFQTTADVEAVVDRNRAIYNSLRRGTPFGPEPMHWVGSIPKVLYAQLERDGIAADPEALKRWLMDPEHSAWLIRPGHL
jgi:3-polyprenyl-4-hydroxybenzoate decarboxylase